jgi:hypothetical protein
MMRWSFNKLHQTLINIHNDLCIGKIPKYEIHVIEGELDITFRYHPSVMLNKNGRGMFYGFANENFGRQVNFVMTNEMQQLVKQILNMCNGKGVNHVKTRMDNLDC